ncbi:MAG: glycine betaine ABC transporter substrate-binding protein [bacterium]
MKRIFTSALFLCLLTSFALTGCRKPDGHAIAIGSKHFTEQEILGEIMAILIEEHMDVTVVRKFNLGGTMICFNALKSGDIDLYAEYTGTGLVNILKMKTANDPDQAYRTVRDAFRKRFDLVWLDPFGFDNTYTLTMRRTHAESLGIEKISDLARYKETLRPGFDAEFLERPDGYKGLIKHYGFEFAEDPRQMDPGLMYKALAEGSVDIIDGFATDGRIPAYDLVILDDDRHFFPPYHAAPLVRKKILSRHPKLTGILKKLGGLIDDRTMQSLNYQVDKLKKSPAEVAGAFLRERGLVKGNGCI